MASTITCGTLTFGSRDPMGTESCALFTDPSEFALSMSFPSTTLTLSSVGEGLTFNSQGFSPLSISTSLSDIAVNSSEQEQPFWFRCVYIALWGKFALYKYVSCWLIAEGVCILTGLGWTGTNTVPEKQINPKLGWASDGWDACSNVRIMLFESTVHFTGKIISFNTNTNSWAARYVFKRLRFLGNKLVSQAVTLMFLAVWHGLHSGYFMCFSLELLIVITERKTLEFVDSVPKLKEVTSLWPVRLLLYPSLYLFQMMFLSYPLVPFCLFSWEKWLRVYSSVYFVGHLIFIAVLLVLPLLRVVLPSKHRHTKDD
uniref:Lysophospholipid acyltransferase 5 n=1 Tax=Eptatretus burgeri TaxID=7764 RepID=A0A8C4QGZ7_EPTBU